VDEPPRVRVADRRGAGMLTRSTSLKVRLTLPLVPAVCGSRASDSFAATIIGWSPSKIGVLVERHGLAGTDGGL
jgi:hypothetical protein